jgi:hypothetical protein
MVIFCFTAPQFCLEVSGGGGGGGHEYANRQPLTSISPRVSEGNPEKLCNFGQQFDPTADDTARSVTVSPSNSETATSYPK